MPGGYIAMYLRISDDDGDIGLEKRESISISNQRKVLLDFIKEDVTLAKYSVREFLDDGYSGVNFRRPGIQKLLKEVQEGNVECIIVKDLSRFGRNYVEAGDYIEQIFPFLGIRFIAVSDRFDSFENSGGIEVGFKNLIHDLYSKDLSQKIKSVKRMYQEKGGYCGGDVPYGYIYTGNKKTEAAKEIYLPDPEAANIVKRIFFMAANGKKVSEIAECLNEEGISIPGIYKNRTANQNYRIKNRTKNLWTNEHIRGIIQNEVYLGIYVCRKSTTVSPKEAVQNERTDYLKFENAHQGLVTKEVFDAAQKAIQTIGKRGRYKKDGNVPALQGKVKCGYCGYSMNYNGRSANKSYVCRMGKSCGSCLRINADVLERTVLDIVTAISAVIRRTEKREIIERSQEYLKSRKMREEQRILEMKAERYKTHRMLLYRQWKDGNMTKEKYIGEKNESIQKEAQCCEELWELERKLEQISDQEKVILSNPLDHFGDMRLFSKKHIDEWVERIDVYGIDRVEIRCKAEISGNLEKS